MKTLYVSDLDGTLLNREGVLPARTAEGLAELIRRGMLFSYATARSYTTASAVTRALPVGLPVIVYNGVMIRRSGSGEVISSLAFSGQERALIRRVLGSHRISPLAYAILDGRERVSYRAGEHNEGMDHYLSSRRGDPRLREVADDAGLYEGESFYFTCIGEYRQLEPVRRLLAAEGLTCVLQQELYREEYWCEIMPPHATKAEGVLRLKELLGCGRVVSFGDRLNDLPMFRCSDECYAVENAVPELKLAATGVIGSNEEDGVLRWLMEHSGF